ncbi:hypothetical protein ABK040_011150 [Willaertia magna]
MNAELLQIRQERLTKLRENREFKEKWEEEHKVIHLENLKKRNSTEKFEMQLEMRMALKKKRKEELQKKLERNLVLSEIDGFEKNLQSFRKEEPTHEKIEAPPNIANNASQTKNFKQVALKKSNSLAKASVIPQQTEEIQTAVPTHVEETNTADDAGTFIQRIKLKKQENILQRKENEQRRRKAFLEQSKIYKEFEEIRRKEILLQKLLKKSEVEKVLAQNLQEIKNHKEIFKENRRFRELQYKERILKDEQQKEVLHNQILQAEKEERRLKKEKFIENYKLLQSEKKQKKYEKHYNICNEIVTQLIDLASKEAVYKEIMEGSLPTKEEIVEWKTFFVKGIPIDNDNNQNLAEDLRSTHDNELLTTFKKEDEMNQLEELDWLEFLDYYFQRATWKEEKYDIQETSTDDNLDNPIDTTHPISKNLKNVFNDINRTLYPLPESRKAPILQSKFKYNILILGKPLSGKTYLVNRLSKDLNLIVIDLENILKSLFDNGYQPEIANSGSNTSSNRSSPTNKKKKQLSTIPENNGLSPQLLKQQQHIKSIIEKAREQLMNGSEISDDVLVEIIYNEILQIENNYQSDTCNGWVIDGFPLRLRLAVLLEERITGFTTSLNDFIEKLSEEEWLIYYNHNFPEEKKKSIQSEGDEEPKLNSGEPLPIPPRNEFIPRKKSLLLLEEAFWDNSAGVNRISEDEIITLTELIPFKAFTSVIFIDIPDEVVFERLSNLKMDPITNKIYNMNALENPLDIEVMCRLRPIDESLQYDKSQMTSKCLHYKTMKKECLEWYKRFNNIIEIDETNLDSLFSRAEEEIKLMSRKKEVVEEEDTITISLNLENAEISESLKENSLSFNKLIMTKHALEREIAKMFEKEWFTMEEVYIKGIKLIFRNLREYRKLFLQQMNDLKQQFIHTLKQPDEKIDVFMKYANDFNSIEQDVRGNIQVKQQLHLQTEELRDSLWNIIDSRKTVFETEVENYKKETFLVQFKKFITRNFIQLIQLELNRFIQQSKFLFDYFNEVYFNFASDPNFMEAIYPSLQQSLQTQQPSSNIKPSSSKKDNNPPPDPFIYSPVFNVNIEEYFIDLMNACTENSSTLNNNANSNTSHSNNNKKKNLASSVKHKSSKDLSTTTNQPISRHNSVASIAISSGEQKNTEEIPDWLLFTEVTNLFENCTSRAITFCNDFNLITVFKEHAEKLQNQISASSNVKGSKKIIKQNASSSNLLQPQTEIPKEIEHALNVEKVLFARRLNNIIKKYKDFITKQMDNKILHLFKLFDNWIANIYKNEMKSIDDLIYIIQLKYIEMEKPLDIDINTIFSKEEFVSKMIQGTPNRVSKNNGLSSIN